MADFLADLVLEIGRKDFSGDEHACIRQHLLDGIASAFIGCRTSTFGNLKTMCCQEVEGLPVPGAGWFRASMADGAMLWAYAINASVFEDGSREGGCHPAAAVIPAVLAVASSAPWEEVDRAMVAGYDVMVRLARGGNPRFTSRGFHPTSITAPFGAAAAASLLLALDRVRTRNALCLAAMASSGLMSSFKGGETQPLQVAWAVRGGLLAALLAGAGRKGYRNILEEGFYRAYLGEGPDPPPDRDLPHVYAIRGSYLKPYPGCRHLHPAIDAFGRLWDESDFAPEDVERVTVRTYKVAVETEIHELSTRVDAYFNIPYAIAARAVLGRCDYDAFDERHFRDGRLRTFMRKVGVEIDPQLDERYPHERGAVVEITTRDGKKVATKVSHALGEPENPLSLQATAEKFDSLSRGFLGEDAVDRIVNLIYAPDPNESPGEVFAMLGKNKLKPR